MGESDVCIRSAECSAKAITQVIMCDDTLRCVYQWLTPEVMADDGKNRRNSHT